MKLCRNMFPGHFKTTKEDRRCRQQNRENWAPSLLPCRCRSFKLFQWQRYIDRHLISREIIKQSKDRAFIKAARCAGAWPRNRLRRKRQNKINSCLMKLQHNKCIYIIIFTYFLFYFAYLPNYLDCCEFIKDLFYRNLSCGLLGC